MKKVFYSFVIIVSIVLGVKGWNTYKRLYVSNVSIVNKSSIFINIPTGSTFEDVKRILVEQNIVKNIASFEWVSEKLNYVHYVKPGRYKINSGINNKLLVGLLRSGQQTPVKLKFSNARNINVLARVIDSQLEFDSAQFVQYFENEQKLKGMGFNKANSIAMFIPNTYEVYWNISIDEFAEKMNKEYDRFWNEKRKTSLDKVGLNKIEVSILASIINEESSKPKEYETIAGLYINRLRRNMPLQADPTVKFGLGDFTIKRILLKHLEVNSPYNTYKNTGLPPGPICMPSISAIDAVLNYKEHKYLYFCAKSDFSGYHTFATTLMQHNQNAKAYQAALNKMKIYK